MCKNKTAFTSGSKNGIFIFHGHVSRGETFLVSETFSLFFGDFDEKRRAGFS